VEPSTSGSVYLHIANMSELRSQEPSTATYPEQRELNVITPSYSFEIHFNIILVGLPSGFVPLRLLSHIRDSLSRLRFLLRVR
jgi:hypothetical protein